MEYIGIIGLIVLLGMFVYAIKAHKSPYDETKIEKYLREGREEAYRLIKRVKNKRK